MAFSFIQGSLLASLLLASPVLAQTSTDCNPTETTCSADTALSSSTYSVDFTKGADNSSWTAVAGSVSYTSSGAEFTINKKGDSPTIQTSWYFFFGRLEVHTKAASGTGIVSSVVLESDDLDEVDWEWLGGSSDEVQTNYFGKGNTTDTTRGGTTTVTDTQSTSHNYTLNWSSESIVWYVDGSAIRTLKYADALSGANYPQTPMRVKLGIWAGGDSDNAAGTISWAGGQTDYDKAPFTMTVESVTLYNANPASEYVYGDKTGSYSSIEIVASNGTSSSSSNSSSSSTHNSSNSTSSSTTNSSSTSSTVAVSLGSSLLHQLSLLPGMAAAVTAYFLL